MIPEQGEARFPDSVQRLQSVFIAVRRYDLAMMRGARIEVMVVALHARLAQLCGLLGRQLAEAGADLERQLRLDGPDRLGYPRRLPSAWAAAGGDDAKRADALGIRFAGGFQHRLGAEQRIAGDVGA